MAIIFLRTAINGVQSSLYVVYLNGVGLTGTSIGILFATIEITSGVGSLFAGRAMRLGDPQRTMLSGTVLSILLICVAHSSGGQGSGRPRTSDITRLLAAPSTGLVSAGPRGSAGCIPEVRFAPDSLLEGTRFEPSVPR
jgi:hypothetical protein